MDPPTILKLKFRPCLVVFLGLKKVEKLYYMYVKVSGPSVLHDWKQWIYEFQVFWHQHKITQKFTHKILC